MILNSLKCNFPETELYHYTSLNTLVSIIQNKTIRLTDYRFLNDTRELIYGLEKIETIAKKYDDEYSKIILSAINNIKSGKIIINTIDKKEDVNYLRQTISNANFYVLSLSQKRDELPLWKMYAKHGCCIKFNGRKMLQFFHSFRDDHFNDGIHNISNGEVIYGDDQIYQYLVNTLISEKNPFMLYDELLQIALKCKCKSFAYEKEFRIAFPFSKKQISDSEKFEFIVSDDIIKPQIELKNFPVDELIEEIIISPFLSRDIVKIGVDELLKVNGLSKTLTTFSEIQIR